MKSVLTPEDKKTLRYICRYFRSHGLENVSISHEIDDPNDGFSFSDITKKDYINFSIHYNVNVPEQLYPILNKIKVIAQKKYNKIDISEDITYATIDFDIDTKRQEISINYLCYYSEPADTESTTVSESDDEKVNEIIDSVREVCGDYDFVELNYNGYGDDGYIDGYFEEPFEQVPADVDSYCYDMLENEHEGWELNEGSNGHFIFDLVDRSITLNHTQQIEKNDTYTLFEESFAK